MFRYVLLLCCTITLAHAAPSVGITSLLYGESDAHMVFTQMGDALPPSIKVRPQILKSINTHITMYHSNLIRQLFGESNSNFQVFDADNEFHSWQLLDPKLVKTIKNTTEIIPDSTESKTESQAIVVKPGGSRFMLLGFIESISEVEQHTQVDNNMVLIYNLDMVVRYRLVDMDTHKVVSIFVGMGHGGTARIVSDNNVEFHKSIDNVVNDMMNSLVQDVDHALQVHQADFVIAKRLPPPPKPTPVASSPKK